jgi:hypothetical protein
MQTGGDAIARRPLWSGVEAVVTGVVMIKRGADASITFQGQSASLRDQEKGIAIIMRVDSARHGGVSRLWQGLERDDRGDDDSDGESTGGRESLSTSTVPKSP